MPLFTFVVDPDDDTGASGSDINLFPVYNADGSINIDGLYGSAADPTPVVNYQLTMTIAPSVIEPAAQAQVRLLATKDGQPLDSVVIAVTTSNAPVGLVPDLIITSISGEAIFGIIGLDQGTATIGASMSVDGLLVFTTPIVITVAEQEAPENYNATGYGQFVFAIEPAIANALYPKVQRLSHHEQQAKYGGTDDGQKDVHYFSTAEVTFMPKFLLPV